MIKVLTILLSTLLALTSSETKPADEPVKDPDSLEIETLYPYKIGDVPESNPNHYMAHNIYLWPDIDSREVLSAVSVDIRMEYAPPGSYWSIGYAMDNSSLAGPVLPGQNKGGSYCGFQNLGDTKAIIGSVWDTDYVMDGERVTAHADLMEHYGEIYYKDENNQDVIRFGGEGEGARCVAAFNWESGRWYRILIRAYEAIIDMEGNTHTLLDQWIQDRTTGEWTLIARYDTGKSDSGMKNVYCFLENQSYPYADEVRSVQWKNIYKLKKGEQNWEAVKHASIGIGGENDENGKPNKKGGFVFGSTDTYFYGITCGTGENLLLADPSVSRTSSETIKNTAQPTDLNEVPGWNQPIYEVNLNWDRSLLNYPDEWELNLETKTGERLVCFEREGSLIYSLNYTPIAVLEDALTSMENGRLKVVILSEMPDIDISWDTGPFNDNELANLSVQMVDLRNHCPVGFSAPDYYRSYTGIWFAGICSIQDGTAVPYDSSWLMN